MKLIKISLNEYECIDMKSKQIEILERLSVGDLTIEQADKELLGVYIDSGRPCGVKDRTGREICFGDTVRFMDKWEWYRSEWVWKFLGTEGEEYRKLKLEYDNLPFEERKIENVQDYEWLLSSDIQTYWEVILNGHD